MKNRIVSRKESLRLTLLGIGLFACGCASTGSAGDEARPTLGRTVDVVAEELARAARQRIDLSSMRVCLRKVTEIEAEIMPPMPVRSELDDLGYLAEEISGELVLALSSRFNLIDTDLFDAPVAPPAGKAGERNGLPAEHFGATHLVVGTLAAHGDEVLLNIRLVDAGNWVIIATARGVVPVQLLSDRSRVALGDLPPARNQQEPRAVPPSPAEKDRFAEHPREVTVPDVGVAALEEEPSSIVPIDSALTESAPEPAPDLEVVAAAKPPRKPVSDRGELDLLLHSTATYTTPVNRHDPKKLLRPGPAEARFTALGRSWN